MIGGEVEPSRPVPTCGHRLSGVSLSPAKVDRMETPRSAEETQHEMKTDTVRDT